MENTLTLASRSVSLDDEGCWESDKPEQLGALGSVPKEKCETLSVATSYSVRGNLADTEDRVRSA